MNRALAVTLASLVAFMPLCILGAASLSVQHVMILLFALAEAVDLMQIPGGVMIGFCVLCVFVYVPLFAIVCQIINRGLGGK